VIPSAGDVLATAIGLVLAGAGLPEAATPQNGHTGGTGFLAVLVAGEMTPRAAVTWHEDGKPTGGTDGPAGKLRDCEQALRRAGFHIEYTTDAAGARLLAWRRAQTR
jgi:hypothetical protein